jgi:hypothetical protein
VRSTLIPACAAIILTSPFATSWRQLSPLVIVRNASCKGLHSDTSGSCGDTIRRTGTNPAFDTPRSLTASAAPHTSVMVIPDEERNHVVARVLAAAGARVGGERAPRCPRGDGACADIGGDRAGERPDPHAAEGKHGGTAHPRASGRRHRPWSRRDVRGVRRCRCRTAHRGDSPDAVSDQFGDQVAYRRRDHAARRGGKGRSRKSGVALHRRPARGMARRADPSPAGARIRSAEHRRREGAGRGRQRCGCLGQSADASDGRQNWRGVRL